MDTGERKLKRAVIVTKSTNFEPRAEFVGEYLKSRDVSVTYIFSDFSHREKRKLHRNEPDHIYIDTFPYRKNLSWQRIWSQIAFAKKTEKKLRELDYDLLYVLIPGNSLVPMGIRAVREKGTVKTSAEGSAEPERRQKKLVFDIIDLWPESLRLGKLEGVWPFTYWKMLRDRDISKADLIITECDLYREKLELDPQKSVTMYWGKQEQIKAPEQTGGKEADTVIGADTKDDLQIAYLGAINNIIDIEGIVQLLQKLNKGLAERGQSVLLHVIGDGEKRDAFLKALDAAGVRCIYHGAVFDEAQKASILGCCSYGLNMMKPGVCVGLTMKSIDYWSHGLPVINNIPGDSEKLCREDGLGINTDNPGEVLLNAVMDRMLTDETSRKHIRDTYMSIFTEKAMYRILDEYLIY